VDTTSGRTAGRNEPCPCGSGKKYKHCCLEKDETKAREARVKAAEKDAKAAAKAAKAAEKDGAKDGAAEAGKEATARQPKKPQTYQPWKRTGGATNTHGFQRMSTPRKVGGS